MNMGRPEKQKTEEEKKKKPDTAQRTMYTIFLENLCVHDWMFSGILNEFSIPSSHHVTI